MNKCPFCGAQINDDSLFCTECGKPIPQGSVCPHCGTSISDGDTFCQSCGKRVDESPSTDVLDTTQKKCPYCGTSVDKDDIFCENCGRNIVDGSIGLTPNEVRQEIYLEEASSSKNKLPIILIVLAVAIIGGGLWYWISSNKNGVKPTKTPQIAITDSIEEVADSVIAEKTPEEIVKERVDYIFNDVYTTTGYADFDAVYLTKELNDLLYKDAEVTPEGCLGYMDYDHWTQSQGGNGKPSYIVKSAEIITDNKATANITINYSESTESKNVKLVLIRKGDDWLIDDFITYYNGHEQSEKQGLIDYIKSMQERSIGQYDEITDTVV